MSGTPSGGGDNEVSVARLFIDGRRAQAADLSFTGDWAHVLDWANRVNGDLAQQRSGWWKWWTNTPAWAARWSHANSSEPATISFTGNSAAILFDRLGHCGFLSINAGATQIWHDSCRSTGRARYVAVSLPSPDCGSRWPLVAWLGLFLIVAAAFRPWKGNARLWRWLLFFLIVLHFLAWSTQAVGIVYDSLGEMTALRQWEIGYPGYWPPSYPLLMALGYLLSAKYTGAVITLIQHLLMVATIWWCARLLERCAGPSLAFLVGLSLGAAAPILCLPQTLQSENVAMFGMAGALYFATLYRDAGRTRYGITSGVLLAWGGMARMVPFAGAIPAVLAVLSGSESLTLGVRRLAVVLATVGTLVTLPIAWFGAKSGHFSLSSSLGHHLYDRVVSGQGLINQTAPATERFIALSAPFTVRELTDIRFAPGRHDDLQNNLIVKGLDYWDVDEMMRAVAYEGIRTAPLAFITFSFHEAWTQYFDDPTPMLAWWSIPPAYPPELESGPILGVRAGSLLWRELLGQQFAVIWKWVPWIALIGVVLVPLMHERLILLGIVLLPSGYLLSLAFLELEVPRYTAAVVPFVFAVAAVAPAATLGLLQGPTRATIDRLSWQRIRNWVRSSAVRASD